MLRLPKVGKKVLNNVVGASMIFRSLAASLHSAIYHILARGKETQLEEMGYTVGALVTPSLYGHSCEN